VPRENIIGRGAMIFFSYGAGNGDRSEGLRLGRIGTLVR
jgi:signal peptidase I